MFYVENKQEEALAFIQHQKLDIVNNHLLCYMAANLAVNNKKTTLAGSIMQNRNLSADYLKLPVWDFEMGYVKLYHLELAEATKYLVQYQNDFKGNFYNYLTYLKDKYPSSIVF